MLKNLSFPIIKSLRRTVIALSTHCINKKIRNQVKERKSEQWTVHRGLYNCR